MPVSSLWNDGKPSEVPWLYLRVKALCLGKAVLNVPGPVSVRWKRAWDCILVVMDSRFPSGRAEAECWGWAFVSIGLSEMEADSADIPDRNRRNILGFWKILLRKKIHVTLIAYVFSSEHPKFLLTIFLTYKYCFIFPHWCCFSTKICTFQ